MNEICKMCFFSVCLFFLSAFDYSNYIARLWWCIVVILCVPAAIIGGGYFVISFIAKLHRDLSRLHLRSAETPPNQYPFRSFAYDNMPLVIFACPRQ